MLKRILVANRGEIARRIFAACREFNMESVAVYSVPDAAETWWHSADFAYLLNGSTAADSYLDQNQIVAIAAQAGADLVCHPSFVCCEALFNGGGMVEFSACGRYCS